jgi:hypothetical protein
MIRQIKSKKRVAEHGEVFTNQREVNAMLDMVKSETDRIESRFLEPACGDGNFLSEILRRKLARVKRQYGRNNSEYAKNAFLALTSIYGIDILEDNVKECRERLFEIWNKAYTLQCKKEANDEIRNAAKYILSKNILCGDALTLLQNNGKPITFSQWDFTVGYRMRRRDFTLDALMRDEEPERYEDDGQMNLVEMMAEKKKQGWDYDAETRGWTPAPIREFPSVDYWEVQYATEI